MSNQQSDEQSNRRSGKPQQTSEAGAQLRRALSVWGAGAFVVTSMIGIGIFTVPADVRVATGNPIAALGVWVMGATLALFGAFCYAELATRMPRAGGEYQYLSHIYGRPWGFIGGWITFFAGFAAPTAASTIMAVKYFSPLAPGWNPDAPLIGWLGLTQGTAVAALLPLLLALPHSIGVKPSGRLQTTLALMTVTAIIVFTVAGVSSGRGDWGRVIQGSEASGAWLVALIQASFAYLGWNAAAYLAGEVTEPRRTLPRALISGTIAVAVLYIALNLLYFYAIPVDAWKAAMPVAQQAAEHLFGLSGGKLVSAIIMVTIVGAISAYTASGPRIYYAMARDGLAPSIFGRLGKRSQAPVIAIFSQAAIASVMALTSAFGSLLLYVGSALLLISALTVAAVYVVRRSEDDDPKSNFSVPGYPFTPAIYILLVIFSWIQTLQKQPMPAIYAIVTIAAGVAVYYVGRARGWITTSSKIQSETETRESDI
ncbi:MAG TPA: amino acid permease [Blastocatellia bacterium]|jgi:APA family basic amino acid/polyamine antiporter|nr:amino acid permease [Blastocatellia bacterium]